VKQPGGSRASQNFATELEAAHGYDASLKTVLKSQPSKKRVRADGARAPRARPFNFWANLKDDFPESEGSLEREASAKYRPPNGGLDAQGIVVHDEEGKCFIHKYAAKQCHDDNGTRYTSVCEAVPLCR
jgi:hypothetical protein